MQRRPSFALHVFCIGAAIAISSVAQAASNAWFQEESIFPLAPQANANFGFSLSAKDDEIAIGEPAANVNGFNLAGRVSVLRRSGGPRASIIDVDQHDGSFFGWSVAIQADQLYVGIPYDSTTASGSGAVSQFNYDAAAQRWHWSGSSFGQSSGAQVGYALARVGDLYAEGWPGAIVPYAGGVVGIGYETQPFGSFAFLAEPSGVDGDFFGASIALYWNPDRSQPDLLVIGAPHRAGSRGAAYVWSNAMHDAMNWQLVASLTAPGPATQDSFGTSVAIGPRRVVVGAPGRSHDGTNNSGSVFVFVPDGSGGWQREQEIVLANAAQDDAFGTSVAYDPLHDRVFGGAPSRFHNVFGGSGHTGSVFVFKRILTIPPNTFSWLSTADLYSLDQPSIGQAAGRALAVDGDRVFVGAPSYKNGSFVNSGRVLSFVADQIFVNGFE